MKSSGKLLMLVLTVVVALLFLSELIFSSVPSLGRLGETAAQLGWSSAGTAAYFVVLGLLNLAGGVLAVRVLMRREETAVRNLNLILVLYGMFQVAIAFLLPPQLRFLYVGIGVGYGLMGALYGRFGAHLYAPAA